MWPWGKQNRAAPFGKPLGSFFFIVFHYETKLCSLCAFGVCKSLQSRDKSLNMFKNVSGFHLQYFFGFCAHLPCRVIFFGLLVVSWIPQRVKICRNFKWILLYFVYDTELNNSMVSN